MNASHPIRDAKHRRRAYKRILESAMKEPGVKDVMDVLNASQGIDESISDVMRAFEPVHVISASDNTHDAS